MLSPAGCPSPSPAISPYVEPSISSSSSSSDETEYDATILSKYFPFLLLIVALLFFLVEGSNPNPFDEHRRFIHEHERIMRRRQRQQRRESRRQPREEPPRQPNTPPTPGDELGSIVCTYRGAKKNEDENGGEGMDCAICLEDFKFGDECQIFMSCNHGFHKSCIDQWLALEPHCPLCRGSVRGLVSVNLDQV